MKDFKHKVGDRLLLEVVVTEVDEQDIKGTYLVNTGNELIWTSEEDLFQQLEAIPAQQNQTIDRAQMAAIIFSGLTDIMNPDNRITQSVIITDKLISELNKPTE